MNNVEKRLLNVELLIPGLVLANDIYQYHSDVILYKQGTILTEKKIKQLKKFKNISILVELDKNYALNQNNQEVAIRKLELDFKKLYEYASYIVSSILKKKDVNIILKNLDPDTYGHSYQVAVIATMIAMNLEGFTRSKLEELAVGAILHDIGKSTIDFSILNKPGKLTSEEYRIVQTHTQNGYNILKKTGLFSDNICDSVLSHYENEDGSGYPNKKIGDEISLYARIIHLADVYSALTNKRSYKEEWTSERAFEQIEKEKFKFESHLIDILKNSLPFYSKGDIVYLSSNDVGKVIDSSSAGTMIKVFGDKKIINVNENEDNIYVKRKILC